jgi:hypothetical protein
VNEHIPRKSGNWRGWPFEEPNSKGTYQRKNVLLAKDLLCRGTQQGGQEIAWENVAQIFQRRSLKASSTQITWVPAPHLNNKDVLRVEADLIEAMNPEANQNRPAPKAHLQKYEGHF